MITWGDQTQINDPSPVCDNYHYYDPKAKDISLPLTQQQIDKMKSDMKKIMKSKMSEYQSGYQTTYEDLGSIGLRDRSFSFASGNIETTVSGLHTAKL